MRRAVWPAQSAASSERRARCLSPEQFRVRSLLRREHQVRPELPGPPDRLSHQRVPSLPANQRQPVAAAVRFEQKR